MQSSTPAVAVGPRREVVADGWVAPKDDAFSFEAPLPTLVMSADGSYAALFHAEPLVHPSDVNAPSATVARLQIDTRTLGPRLATRSSRVDLACLVTGRSVTVSDSRSGPVWPIGFSRDGRDLAFAVGTPDGTELHRVDCATGRSNAVARHLNATPVIFGERPGCWIGHGNALVTFMHADVRSDDVNASTAISSDVFDTRPEAAEEVERAMYSKIERYLSSQLSLICLESGTIRPIGPVGLYRSVSVSPDGRYLLVTRHSPLRGTSVGFVQWRASAEVWELCKSVDGILVRASSAQFRADDTIGYGAPLRWYWHPTRPATIVRLDQRENAPDRIVALPAPFDAEPDTLYETAERCIRYCWTPSGTLLVLESELGNRRLWAATPSGPRMLLSTSRELGTPGEGVREPWRLDAVHGPGERRPIWNAWGTGDGLVAADGTRVYLSSRLSETGEATLIVEAVSLRDASCATVYTSPRGMYESIVGLVGSNSTTALICRESPITRPRFSYFELGTSAARSINGPQERGDAPPLLSRVIHVQAAAGSVAVEMFFPAAATQPVPAVIWIHPQLGRQPAAVREANRYVAVDQHQGLFLARHGFAVVHYPPFTLDPYGDPDEPQRMLEEMAVKAAALIEALRASGIADADRIGIGGHCLGAYAAAMLLGRTTLFRAGAASAGRYNLASIPHGTTLTAHRELFDASSLFVSRSPLRYASDIRAPLLLLHGGSDEIIPPTESEGLFRAIAKSGGRCRYVRVLHEGHTYRTRDGVRTFRTEVAAWFRTHLAARGTNECLDQLEKSNAPA